MTDPWGVPIDAKGVVRRKKLKSNVELTSTRTVVVCPDCREAVRLETPSPCKTCNGTERILMVYTVQCVIRLAEFSPLTLPAALLMGTKQPHIKYIDTADRDHRSSVLRDRALEGLQSAAGRVVRAHHAQHGSRLLMGRVSISRRQTLTISVASGKGGKSRRLYDVEDGADGRLTEVTLEVAAALAAVSSSDAAASRASLTRVENDCISRSSSRSKKSGRLKSAPVADCIPPNRVPPVSLAHVSSKGATGPRTLLDSNTSSNNAVSVAASHGKFASTTPCRTASAPMSLDSNSNGSASLATSGRGLAYEGAAASLSKNHLSAATHPFGGANNTPLTHLSPKRSLRTLFGR